MCANSRALSSALSATNASAAIEQFRSGIRVARRAGKMTAESARAWHGAEQAGQMPRDRVQPCSLRKLALDIGNERLAASLVDAKGASSPNTSESTASRRHGS